ncbi:MAG TPA: class I adenylate-forming enzyme family protein [Solirubrobacteraceae bacterium]|nr:class I adenylate-forming enzyme family protein [Solirubrobacteraceae bacterium]
MTATVEHEGAPLCATIEQACERWSSRPAITAEGTTITYGALWERASSLAAAYQRLGIGPGDRVLCQLRNCPEHVVAIAATWMRGAIQVGADNDLTAPELTALVRRLGASALVFQPRPGTADGLAPVRAVLAECPDLRVIVHAPQADPYPSLEHLMTEGGKVAPEVLGPLDTAVLFLTSGTTGEPKAIIESRAAHWAKMQMFADGFLPGVDDVHLLYLPMSHVFGFRLALLALLRGGRLILLERFSPLRALELVEEERVTVLPAVPAHLRLLREHYDPERHDVGSLRWVLAAAAGLPRELAAWVYEALDARIMFVYGCSEGFTTLTNDAEDILAGSVGNNVFRGPPGTPAAGTVRIIDPDTGAALSTGATGEITYGSVMPVDYWDHPPVAVDGWYRTGDLGHIDERGRVYVTGRIKELINRGGLHVSITEVETALLRHPSVGDGAVIATPDAVMGEAVCACIVPAAATPPELGELRRFLAEHLARHKLPDELAILETIPRTDIGKVDRRALSGQLLSGTVPRQRARG